MGEHRKLFTVFKNLKHLNLSRNSLNKHFFEYMKALYLVGVYQNNIKGEESKEVQCKLETLNLSYNNITKVEAKILKDWLGKIDTLHTLSLNNNKLGVSGA